MDVRARPAGMIRWLWRFRLLLYIVLGFGALDAVIASQHARWRQYDPDDYVERVQLCRREPRDVVVIGGSPVSEGIDPAILSGLQFRGENLSDVFNVGLPGGTIAEFWHAIEHGLAAPPRLLVYGITASDLNDSRNEPHGPYSLMDMSDVADWVTSRPNSAEWAVRHYARGQLSRCWQLYRYRNAIRLWATDCAERAWPGFSPAAAAEMLHYRLYALALERPDGFAPNPSFRERRLDLLKAAGVRCDSFPFLDRYRMGEQFAYFDRLLAWADRSGVPVVFVDMPVSHDLQDGLHGAAFETYRAWLAGVERERSLRVLRAHRDTVGLTDADFADFIHLNSQGANRLSKWIRAQLDEPVRTVQAGGSP